MKRALLLAFLALAASSPAFAHPGHEFTFAAGLAHPFSGADHVLAMVCVGVWAAFVGGSRVWFWPLTFVTSAVVGGTLGHFGGNAITFIEPAIALSVIALGLLIAFEVRAPLLAGAVLLVAAGLAHGYAHGIEAPAQGWTTFAFGFASGTAALHAAGLALGLAIVRGVGERRVAPVLGTVAAGAGCLMLAS